MNIYIRYFDEETLCHNITEVRDFLKSIGEINVTQKMLDDIADYASSDMLYPKRYKTTSRNYFIMIKTPLETLAEFHANGKDKGDSVEAPRTDSKYDIRQAGWYRCVKHFKRLIPGASNKSEYVDTSIEVLLFGESPRDCHDKIVTYLQQRNDIDPRSQYPAIKESNFEYEYSGAQLAGE